MHLNIDLPIDLYLKNPAGMHWLGRNDALMMLKVFKCCTNVL